MASSITWEELKSSIARIFSNEHVDVEEVKRVMNSYSSNWSDWKSYEKFDDHTYTRNLVDQGNGRYNLIVLCWDSGQGSSIHNHANSHCFMKILRGVLKETTYEWPNEDQEGLQSMVVKEEMTHKRNDMTYINDTIGLHRVENPSHTDPAISLHLYCPPIITCKSFEERTGKCHSCRVTFHSSQGERVVNC